MYFGHANHRTEMRERLLGKRHVRVVRMSASAQTGHALVHHRRGVRHGAAHRHTLGQVCLDARGRDGRRDAENRLLRRDGAGDIGQQALDVLGLDRQHDESRSRRGLGIRAGDGDAEALPQLRPAFFSSRGGDDVARRTPARREQACHQCLADPPRTENRDPALVYRHGGQVYAD
jgi:hypothetical protein